MLLNFCSISRSSILDIASRESKTSGEALTASRCLEFLTKEIKAFRSFLDSGLGFLRNSSAPFKLLILSTNETLEDSSDISSSKIPSSVQKMVF